MQNDHNRLPRNVKPLNYKLHLAPNINNKTFEGNVSILLQILEPTNIIIMHAKDLIIHDVNLKNVANAPIESSIEHESHNEILQINLENEAKQSPIILSITFSGKLDNKIVGLYSSSLKTGG